MNSDYSRYPLRIQCGASGWTVRRYDERGHLKFYCLVLSLGEAFRRAGRLAGEPVSVPAVLLEYPDGEVAMPLHATDRR